MKILFIQTGGTIDKDYPKTRKGWAFEIDKPAVKRILHKLNPSFSYDILSILKKDSLDINEQDRKLIINQCINSKEDKIIITHGTDSIIDTANSLSEIKNKTIILTGALRPERFSNSDADINLGLAIGGVQSLGNGIYIALSGLIIPHDKITRNSKTDQFQKK
jgi:L-asparaginase